MVRRLILGLLFGLIIGGAVAAGLVWIGEPRFEGTDGMVLSYLAAALTGALTGLVAGKPIWSSGGKIEAGLKSFFGALLGSGLMFALHRWAGAFPIDIAAIGATTQTPVADLPTASLPLLAAVLGGFFELDNTGDNESTASGGGDRKRVATGAAPRKARVAGAGATGESTEDEEAEAAPGRAKR